MCRSYVYNDSFKEMELQSVLCQKKRRELPREFRISTVELEFLFQVFQNIPVTEVIRSTVNLESGFNGRSFGSTIRI